MNPRPHRVVTMLGALAVSATAACTPAPSPPAPDFGASGGTSVGMPGMSAMPGMASSPTAASSTTAPAPPVSGTAVDITNFTFAPATLEVKAGETVTWANRDEEPHTVAADDGSFHSPGMGANTTYSVAFTKPGSYGYTCSIHPFMHGTVVVTP